MTDVLDRLRRIRDSRCSVLCNDPGPFKEPICIGVDDLIGEIMRLREELKNANEEAKIIRTRIVEAEKAGKAK